jgi:hypothetical protein
MINSAKRLLNKLDIDSKRNDDLFPIMISNYGYAMTQALRKADSVDNTFKAVQTLSKAIDDFTTKFSSSEFLYYYFPIIALDSQLFEVKLKNSGEFEIEKAARASYLGRAPRPGNAYFYIDLVTKEDVVLFAEEFSKRVESFIAKYKDQIVP